MANFMGFGLNKPTTWIRPFQTTADLPADALDGSAAVILSTHEIWEFDRTTFTWHNTSSGGGGTFELREVLLTFSATVASGTAINIQTGVYAGVGSPASVDNDTNVTFPASGVTFKGDGRIEVLLNGQEFSKGDGSGNGEAEWVSATQIKMNIAIKNKGQLMIRAPFPTA